MRLSEWRAEAPVRAPVEAKVVAVLEPVLTALGAGPDPHGWAFWGEDVSTRWQYLAPTPAGLVLAFVRVNVAGEGPRASAKVIRWSRVQVGELAMETQGSHRLLSFSVEGIVLKGADAAADRVARFALVLLAAIDGRVTHFDKALAEASAVGRGRRAAASSKATTTAPTKAPTARATSSKAAAVPSKATGTPKSTGSRSRTTRAAG